MSPPFSNEPICPDCFNARHPGRQPTHLKEPERETCVDCGAETRQGIYLRVDLGDGRAQFPSRRTDRE